MKERNRMMNSHRSDAEKVSLIEEGKKIGINEVIKRNEIINKFKIKGYDNSWKGKMERL